jgi:hypothetical protein
MACRVGFIARRVDGIKRGVGLFALQIAYIKHRIDVNTLKPSSTCRPDQDGCEQVPPQLQIDKREPCQPLVSSFLFCGDSVLLGDGGEVASLDFDAREWEQLTERKISLLIR